MKSIVTVTTWSDTYDLTTVDRVKLELGITDNDSNDILTALVHEESASFADLVDRVLASETVTEQFNRRRGDRQHLDALYLTRYPVSSIISVTENQDAALASTLYEVDEDTGALYRLSTIDPSFRTRWSASQVMVAYTGGYTLLDTLPRKIEQAVLTMIKNRWFARGRDPSVKSRMIVDVGTWTYSTGVTGVGTMIGQPSDVQEAIDIYRDIRV